MTTEYEVRERPGSDLPSCDCCGFEAAELETAQGHATIELSCGATRLEELCRYCYETNISNVVRGGGHTHSDTLHARLLAQSMNVLERALRFEMQSGIVGLARAIADDLPAKYEGPERRMKSRRVRTPLGRSKIENRSTIRRNNDRG